LRKFTEKLGQTTIKGIAELGYASALLAECFYWLIRGRSRKQPVKMPTIAEQMMQIGIGAIPITSILSFTIGLMLAIQGIHTLRTFGAESQVVLGIALSVTREFAPLIVGILIAGRTGSALAARVGTMTVSQEIDALRVIGVSPIRYMVAPALLAMIIMVPLLTFYADIVSMLGGAFYVYHDLGLSLEAYAVQTRDFLSVSDITQGLMKSVVFAIIITLVGFINGFSVKEGAEGVGKATTRSVVQGISYIIIADMIFTYFLNK